MKYIGIHFSEQGLAVEKISTINEGELSAYELMERNDMALLCLKEDEWEKVKSALESLKDGEFKVVIQGS